MQNLFLMSINMCEKEHSDKHYVISHCLGKGCLLEEKAQFCLLLPQQLQIFLTYLLLADRLLSHYLQRRWLSLESTRGTWGDKTARDRSHPKIEGEKNIGLDLPDVQCCVQSHTIPGLNHGFGHSLTEEKGLTTVQRQHAHSPEGREEEVINSNFSGWYQRGIWFRRESYPPHLNPHLLANCVAVIHHQTSSTGN